MFGSDEQHAVVVAEDDVGTVHQVRPEPGMHQRLGFPFVQAQRTGSGVAVDGHVYVVNSGPGTAQCIDCRSGKIIWTRRVEGGESWGSVVMVAGRFYVTSRAGVTTVFRADPEKFEILAANDLGEASHATPAVSDGELFLRTDKHLYCIAGQ